jgi:transposase-like protein
MSTPEKGRAYGRGLHYAAHCNNCGATTLTPPEEIPGSHKWAYRYKCKQCSSEHEYFIGDAMGGQSDVIEFEKRPVIG